MNLPEWPQLFENTYYRNTKATLNAEIPAIALTSTEHQIVNTLEVSIPSPANVDECPLKCRWVPLPLKMCYRELMNKTNSPIKELERVTPFHANDNPRPQHPTSTLSPPTPPTKVLLMLVMSLLSFKRQMHVAAIFFLFWLLSPIPMAFKWSSYYIGPKKRM